MRMRALLLVVALLATPFALAAEGALKAGVFSPPRQAPAFSLSGSNGAPLTLADHRGKVVLLGFGFTSCTEVCPITLGTLARVHRLLGAQAADVQVVYVTVDPERDDAAQLKRYLGAFNASFLGGTGSAEALAAVRKDYGIMATKVAGPDGAYDHSSFVYLIDRDGRLRALMPYGREAEDYVHDVRILLAGR